jgi:hypothetical protein
MSGAVSYTWSIKNLEFGAWTPEWNPSINPTPPKSFEIEPVPSGLRIAVAGIKYAGALAKNVAVFPYRSSKISFSFRFKFDESMDYGQVSETDPKITDADGWTYDLSFQLNKSKGWMAQINNPWVDTGIKVPGVQDVWNPMKIDWGMDYVAHTSTLLALNGMPANLPPIPAKQIGWDRNQIITQLQLCTAGQEGEYEITYADLGYTGQ